MKSNEKTVKILTLKFTPMTKRASYEKIKTALSRDAGVSKIYTPNPQMALGAYCSLKLQSVFEHAEMLLPDGIGIIIASKILCSPLPERITGIDTAEFILGLAEKKGLRVALVGGEKGVAEQAKKKLCERLPKLNICFTHHGYFDKDGEENITVLKKLQTASPDILFVCFGFPLQEIWIDENARSVPSLRLCAGLGGALDVWSGNVKRAPKIISVCGMEWLWRIAREPKRYKRLFDIPRFFALVARQRFYMIK